MNKEAPQSKKWVVIHPKGGRSVKTDEMFSSPQVTETMEQMSKLKIPSGSSSNSDRTKSE